MKKRNLDGVYFRVDNENICWTDLTNEQRREVTKNWASENWERLCGHLTAVIIEIGNQLDLYGEPDDESAV